MPISLYLDTNVYLSFYSFCKDDLNELQKLVLLVKNNEVQLFLPEQTKNEFIRNRDIIISDSLKRIKEVTINNRFPLIATAYEEEFKDISISIKQFEKAHKLLVDKINVDALNSNLHADRIINELFDHTAFVETTEDIYRLAKYRFDLGNPPGKNHSYGDAINWESILSIDNMFEGVMHFVTDDKDYYSSIDNIRFHKFLIDEWVKRTNTTLEVYRTLSAFLKKEFPHIKLAAEYEKELLINKLANSSSFFKTHFILAQLLEYNEFNSSQVNALLTIGMENPQVYKINCDVDVKEFFDRLKKDHSHLADPKLLALFEALFIPVTEESGLPF